jgi:Pyruvate/2-oxoacid:ferredoxin oxidoreductase delta subunit/flavodoxin
VYRAVVFFFSGTGNTWWVADKIQKLLDAKGVNADTVSIDSLTPKKADWWIKTADLVIFGWPVYGSAMPEPMKRFVDSLPAVEKGKHVHVFCTQSAFSGDGAWHYHKHFKQKGLIIDSAEHFIMPNSKNGSESEGYYSAVMERCGKRAERHMERLLSGKARIKGKYGGWLGALQRAPFKLYIKGASKQACIDADRCTGCGLCAQLCPENNITLDGKATMRDHCALCMRCAAFCPADAITIPGCKSPYALHDKRFKPSILK